MGKTETNRVTADIIDFLHMNDIFAFRCNTGAVKRGGRYIKFGFPGISDIVGYLPGGGFLGIEIKTGTDKTSRIQDDFIFDAVNSGCLVFVASSLADVKIVMAKEGYITYEK